VHLRTLGYQVLDPDAGNLAIGEGAGPGRLPEPDEILAHVGRLLEPAGKLRGRTVVVTAGPTREPVDPVRFLSNHSSGKMGVAIAEAAWRRGADVRLIAGPISAPVGHWIARTDVESTEEMASAVAEALPAADALVMAAAPADFRAAQPAEHKIKKGNAPAPIELSATPDILLTTRERRKAGAVVVGFALETRDVIASAQDKLARKGLDLVVANDATEAGAGFGVDTNRVTFVARGGSVEPLALQSKRDVAEAILDRVEALLPA
jgi:phosphopantothenoylcysteine decarboxylase/phosphopantothenate--cysteine ligase